MDDPQYVVVVTLQRPEGSLQVLDPGKTFKKVMQQVLTTRNVPPSDSAPELYPVEY